MSSAVDQAFESLFFGTGAWFGLVLFITVCVGLALKWKYVGALLIPVIIGMEVEYYDRLNSGGNYVWHIFILLCLALFIAFRTVSEIKEGR